MENIHVFDKLNVGKDYVVIRAEMRIEGSYYSDGYVLIDKKTLCVAGMMTTDPIIGYYDSQYKWLTIDFYKYVYEFTKVYGPEFPLGYGFVVDKQNSRIESFNMVFEADIKNSDAYIGEEFEADIYGQHYIISLGGEVYMDEDEVKSMFSKVVNFT